MHGKESSGIQQWARGIGIGPGQALGEMRVLRKAKKIKSGNGSQACLIEETFL